MTRYGCGSSVLIERVSNVFIFDILNRVMTFVSDALCCGIYRWKLNDNVSAFRSKKLETELTISRHLLSPRLLVMQTDWNGM